MGRKCFVFIILVFCLFGRLLAQTKDSVESGIWHIAYGQQDKLTPYSFCEMRPMSAALAALPAARVPFPLTDITVRTNARGTVVEIPLDDEEQLYGLGMQIGSFDQRGLKKRPIVNDNPLNDLGYTHGPTTLYWSNRGYGILVNTARYTTFYMGTTQKLVGRAGGGGAVGHDAGGGAADQGAGGGGSAGGGGPVKELYRNRQRPAGYVTVDIPGAAGVDLYVFCGPDLRTAVQRYNLFSGGGALPAIWGLGVKYRVKADFNQGQVDAMASYFRNHHIPCDVLGLEPKWQTAAYSCSYVWDSTQFPSHDRFIDSLAKRGFHLNLWEHAFTSPRSPLFEPLKGKAGDYMVWGGLVPDFADPAARAIFAGYHRKTFVDHGIAAFKLDECDNSNLAEGHSTWSFPELSVFPSGLSGEQMHQVFGLLYQKTIYDIFRAVNRRTFLDVRASNDFASAYPAALYSDTYDHKEYIRMIITAGFSGMLWSPEVRESRSVVDLLRRSETAVLSAQTLFNSWYLQHPPWLQIDIDKNNRNELMDSAAIVEGEIRDLLDFRMSLIPYLYNAFADYHFRGIPPFRALVMDYPTDTATFHVSDEYMIGSGLLSAPLTADERERSVYLPAGSWYDFNTNERLEGGRRYVIRPSATELPLFVKAGTILPLADPVEYVPENFAFTVTCRVYGAGDAEARLFEDDGYSFGYEHGGFNTVVLRWKNGRGVVERNGGYKGVRYRVEGWRVIR